MANVQPTAVQNQQNVTDTNQIPLTPITMLLRFLYTGTTVSAIPVKIHPTNLENIDTTLSCVIDLATQRASLPISTIRKTFEGGLYVRVDDVLIALAYACKQMHSEELRKLANNEVPTLIRDQNDFLLFINYCAKISTVLRGAQHLNFGHGMGRLVEKWYEQFSNLELANMFSMHRSLHGWSHQSVIRKSHMRTKKRNAQPTIDNATAISNEGDTIATGTSSTATDTSFTDEDDREQVFHYVFCKGGQFLSYLEDKPELGLGAQRLKDVQLLKTNENVESAVQTIRHHKFDIQQIPAHLLEKEMIWESFLPSLSLKQVLHHFHTLKDFGFLNEQDSPFTQKFIEAFKPDALKSEMICPIYLYILKQLYEKNVRYLGTRKAQFYEKKILKRKIIKNNVIKDRLDDIFNQTLLSAKPASAKFMVVIDLRKGNAKKSVLRNKHINCFEASFLLAYSIYCREKDALVYTFSGTKDQLEPLHHLFPNVANFEMAKEMIDLQSVSHTYQSLAKPIAEATALKKKVDIFVVVVDSVARFCRQGVVPIDEFITYRAKFNDRAKYVVVNLTRPSPDLKIPQTDEMKGFFEICGFNQDTPKILYALATHCFT